MRDFMLKMYIKMQNLIADEEGQDLVEYALVAAVVALGAVASMGKIATALSGAFTSIASQLTSATT